MLSNYGAEVENQGERRETDKIYLQKAGKTTPCLQDCCKY